MQRKDERRLQWLGCVTRMEDERLPKEVMVETEKKDNWEGDGRSKKIYGAERTTG